MIKKPGVSKWMILSNQTGNEPCDSSKPGSAGFSALYCPDSVSTPIPLHIILLIYGPGGGMLGNFLSRTNALAEVKLQRDEWSLHLGEKVDFRLEVYPKKRFFVRGGYADSTPSFSFEKGSIVWRLS